MNNEKKSKAKSPLRHAGQVSLAILNPLSDLAVIYRRGIKPSWEKLKLLAGLIAKTPESPENDSVGTSWAVAVARSGRPIEKLLATFKRIRAAWWGLLAISGSLSLLLLVMLLMANFSLPLSTFLRASAMLLVLGAVASLGFVKALIATYRLWQLQEQRVSVAERGTFKDFLAETRWCRLVLTMGHFH
ncbi:TraX protein [Pseudomonas coronafaciens pv. garcae]|uniref:TraX protein n=6 Tax=Pseudomonas syringae group TaxID=136849 RepID=A0AB37QQ19_9PSED|nr:MULTISPECIES: conjugal transfer protein TraX [Pseudomonas syringae group]RMS01050.1 hypothetical protein ALP74_200502 [Pseudomonas coronafaciens pv. garcae]RMS05743.1 TraX protein [Pseudomonas coronafaciens pv. garcae]RMS25345.1 TraX protein [Pseudomonas coronafaciens pv. garcae]